jgi:hypothetical protein
VDAFPTDDGTRLRLTATGRGSHTIGTGLGGRSTDSEDTSGGRYAHHRLGKHTAALHQPNGAGFTDLAAAQRRTAVTALRTTGQRRTSVADPRTSPQRRTSAAAPRTTASLEPISSAPSTG